VTGRDANHTRPRRLGHGAYRPPARAPCGPNPLGNCACSSSLARIRKGGLGPPDSLRQSIRRRMFTRCSAHVFSPRRGGWRKSSAGPRARRIAPRPDPAWPPQIHYRIIPNQIIICAGKIGPPRTRLGGSLYLFGWWRGKDGGNLVRTGQLSVVMCSAEILATWSEVILRYSEGSGW
jgi:hypothetical protein